VATSLLTIAGSTVVFIKQREPSKQVFGIKSVASPTIAQSTIPPVSQWKTYQNNTYKFSLSYPDSLEAKEVSFGVGITTIEFKSTKAYPSTQSVQLLIFSKSQGRIIGQDFDTFYTLADNTSKIMKEDTLSLQKFTKVRNRAISKLRAFDYSTTSYPVNPDEEAEIGAYIELGQNILVISTGENNKTGLESILGTFKYPL